MSEPTPPPKRIAVLTSGGDAPGMNAAIRAVARTGIARGFEVYGVRNGFTGLIAGNWTPLGARDVGGIIGRGGTVLGTTRCQALETEAGQAAAVGQLARCEIGGLVVIGGNGSQAGANALALRGVRVVGAASTIDNDLAGTDVSIGTSTALDVALEAIDRLRVTAASHKRVFLVEVMGRNTGHLALNAGIAGGAEAMVLPEREDPPEAVAAEILAAYERGKSHAIVVVAEGAKYNGERLARHFHDHRGRLGFELRVTTLGHVQRGGTPSAFDRVLATRLGAAAVEYLEAGRHGVLLGVVDDEITATPLAMVARLKKPLDARLLELASVLAR